MTQQTCNECGYSYPGATKCPNCDEPEPTAFASPATEWRDVQGELKKIFAQRAPAERTAKKAWY